MSFRTAGLLSAAGWLVAWGYDAPARVLWALGSFGLLALTIGTIFFLLGDPRWD